MPSYLIVGPDGTIVDIGPPGTNVLDANNFDQRSFLEAFALNIQDLTIPDSVGFVGDIATVSDAALRARLNSAMLTKKGVRFIYLCAMN